MRTQRRRRPTLETCESKVLLSGVTGSAPAVAPPPAALAIYEG
jgi:hypothetical protein